MAIRAKKLKAKQQLTDEHESWLRGDDKAAAFVKYAPDAELAALWASQSELIIAEYVADFPGTRPARWWQYSAPRIPLGTYPGLYFDGQLPEPRKRLGGIGTPAFEVLAYVPRYSFGLPVDWVEKWMVKYYSGTAVNIRGEPIGDLYPTDAFKGVAIDPNDPPRFESQAAYLKRLGLFLAGEERRLRKADWEPERVTNYE
jgi:hypothetical protein